MTTVKAVKAPSPQVTGTGSLAHAQRAGALFVLPFMVIFAGFFILPLGYAAYLSFFRDRLIGGVSFVGAENYIRALTDPRMLSGVLRVAQFFLIQVPLMLVLALALALALDSGVLRFAKVFRLGIFVPYAVPAVVATLMWGYLYGRDFGLFNQIARGLSAPELPFFSDKWMLPAIANVVTWEFTGYNMILLYAALRSVPTELYEAAAIDGAGQFKTAWYVKIPAIRGALLMALTFSVIGSFQLFAEPQLLQRLAPTVIDAAYTPNLFAYSLAFTGQELNYAASVSFLLGIVIVSVSSVVQYFANRRSV